MNVASVLTALRAKRPATKTGPAFAPYYAYAIPEATAQAFATPQPEIPIGLVTLTTAPETPSDRRAVFAEGLITPPQDAVTHPQWFVLLRSVTEQFTDDPALKDLPITQTLRARVLELAVRCGLLVEATQLLPQIVSSGALAYIAVDEMGSWPTTLAALEFTDALLEQQHWPNVAPSQITKTRQHLADRRKDIQ